MSGRKIIGIALIFSIALLAGCIGGAPTTSDNPITTPSNSTNQSIESESNTTYPSLGNTPEPMANVSEKVVSELILEAMKAADTYRVNGTISRTQVYPTGTIDATVNTNTTLDRVNNALRNIENTSGHMVAMNTRTIVHNGTYYRYVDNQRNDQPAVWKRSTLGSGEFDRLDPLYRQRHLITNSTVTVTNSTTSRTGKAYVVHVDVNESAYSEFYDRQIDGKNLNVTGVAYRYVVDKESGQVIEMTGLLRSHTGSGESSVKLLERYDLTFTDYCKAVSIEAPKNTTTAS